MAHNNLRIGDHVSFYRHQALHASYGTVRKLIQTDVGGEFVEVLAEGADHTLQLPVAMVKFYAHAGATK